MDFFQEDPGETRSGFYFFQKIFRVYYALLVIILQRIMHSLHADIFSRLDERRYGFPIAGAHELFDRVAGDKHFGDHHKALAVGTRDEHLRDDPAQNKR